MKVKRMRCLFLLFVCSFANLFYSCDSDGLYKDYDERTLTLCLNEWVQYTADITGETTRQTLLFHLNGTGYESLYKPDIEERAFHANSFQWKWLSGTTDTLWLQYGDDEAFYFENVQVGNNVLYGLWAEQEICFHAVVK